RGMLKLLNWTIGRAGGPQIPQVRQFLEQERSFRKAAPARAGGHDLKNPHLPFQRDRQNIAGSDRLGRGLNPPRIEPHVALGDKPRRDPSRLGHTREPKPFVEPLPQRHAFAYVLSSINMSTGSKISSEQPPLGGAKGLARVGAPGRRKTVPRRQKPDIRSRYG